MEEKQSNRENLRKNLKIKEICDIILNTATKGIVHKIYLFGSYAYGEPNERSDVDILAIIENDTDKSEEYANIKMELRRENINYCDLIMSRKSDFYDSVKTNQNSIEHLITTQGEVLYG